MVRKKSINSRNIYRLKLAELSIGLDVEVRRKEELKMSLGLTDQPVGNTVFLFPVSLLHSLHDQNRQLRT